MNLFCPRFVVDGHEFDPKQYPDADYLGDGEFAPFRVFDTELQDYVSPEYQTRRDAQAEANRRNYGERA